MPTSNPRVNVVLEPPLFAALKRMADKDAVSLSTKVRDIVRGALEEYEDAFLVELADKRVKTFKRSKAVSHADAWR